MKLLTKILILSFLLTVFSSTSSSNIKDPKETVKEEPSLVFPVLEITATKEVQELREVKTMLTDTRSELEELKKLLEQKKLRDSLLIYNYVNK